MKPWKRTLLNFIIFLVAYAGITFLLDHHIDWDILLIISVVYLVLNYVIYTVLDKVSKK